MERGRRKNGLESPYTPAQLSTWVYLPTLVVEFLLFASPLLPLIASIVCSIVFFVTAVGSAYCGYQAMKIDPSDPRLLSISAPSSNGDELRGGDDLEHNHSNHNNHNHPNGGGVCTWDPNEPTKQCWLCDVQVGEKSMHCKFCNKCVDHFDHHCMWLNTCVGKANYKYFFRTMLWITAMLIIHGSIQFALVLDIYLGNGNTKQRSEDWLNTKGDTSTLVVVIVMCTFLFLDLVALSLILQLLFFHLKLQREGLSTYQFIVRDNKQKREKAQKESLIEQKRSFKMSKAQEEGRTSDYNKLYYGGMLRRSCGITCCDPMEQEEKERQQREQAQQEQQERQQQIQEHSTNDKLSEESPSPVNNGNGHSHQNGNGRTNTATTNGDERNEYRAEDDTNEELKEPEKESA